MTIKFANLNKYELEERHTSLFLLKSFIVNQKCDSTKQLFYANVFLCKTAIKNDTILVFSICKPAYDFLKEGYKGERDLIIDSSKVLNSYPEEVFVNIDDNIIRRGYRFIVGDITSLEY